MKKQKIGNILFWIGLISMIITFILMWIQAQVVRSSTPETLVGTGWAPREGLFSLMSLTMLIGISFSIIGALLYSSKKGSFFWLWAIVPVLAMNVAMTWNPSTHIPAIYGIGAGIITLAYIGVLWAWIKTHTSYEGIAKTGKQIQILGYSFIYLTALFLCNVIGNPMQSGTANLPKISSYSVLIALSIGFVLLSIGHYLTGQQKK